MGVRVIWLIGALLAAPQTAGCDRAEAPNGGDEDVQVDPDLGIVRGCRHSVAHPVHRGAPRRAGTLGASVPEDEGRDGPFLQPLDSQRRVFLLT